MIGLKNTGRPITMGLKQNRHKTMGHKSVPIKNTINQLVPDANPIESNDSNNTQNQFLPMGLQKSNFNKKKSYIEK